MWHEAAKILDAPARLNDRLDEEGMCKALAGKSLVGEDLARTVRPWQPIGRERDDQVAQRDAEQCVVELDKQKGADHARPAEADCTRVELSDNVHMTRLKALPERKLEHYHRDRAKDPRQAVRN